jgi:hypothetical protein
MSHFDPTDPAAEIAYLKAMERAKTPAWPDMPPDPAKAKKAADWPTPVGKPKKPPRHVRATLGAAELPTRPFVQEGIPLAAVARALLLLGMAVTVALLID